MNTEEWCYIQSLRINYLMLRIFLGFFVCDSIQLLVYKINLENKKLKSLSILQLFEIILNLIGVQNEISLCVN